MAKRKRKSTSAVQDKDSGGTLLQPRIGIHRLPIEVLDTVFEHSPKPTLLACTRVSRLWRECSRPYLFASLSIHRDSAYDDFFNFLDANTDIARYVRNLTLGRAHTAWMKWIHPLVSKPLLVELMHKLPRLQELRLCDVHFDTRPTVSDVLALDGEIGLPRLRLISIERCCVMGSDIWMSESVLFDVLSTLAADTIHISTFSTAYQGTEVASGSRFRPLDPRCLVLTYTPAISTSHEMLWRKRLYEVLSRTVASNCLHKLRVGPIERYDVACLTALGDFLFHAGRHTLQDFALPFSITQPLLEVEDKQERWNMLRLDECQNLKSFGVSFQIRTRFGRLPLVLPHVPYSAVAIAILSHLPSTLRQLTIELLDVETDEQIKNKKVLGLRALDDALVDRFPVLEVVRVELRVEYYLLEYTTAVFKTMPKCKNRGILEVVRSREN